MSASPAKRKHSPSPARSAVKAQKVDDASSPLVSSEELDAKVLKQIEYYMSDSNLRDDVFFRKKIESSNEGKLHSRRVENPNASPDK